MSEKSKALTKKAIALRKEGSIEEALVAARAGVAEDDECIESWYQVALNSEDLKKNQQALDAYEKVVELNDEFSYGWARYGKLLKRTGRSADALDAFEMALFWDETQQDALLGLIEINGPNGEHEDIDKRFEALKKYDEAYNLSTATSINALGNGYLKRKYYSEAINCYYRCFEKEYFPYARHNAAIAYAYLNEYLNAIDILEENRGLYPEYEPSQTNIKSYTEIINKNTGKLKADSYNLLDKKEFYDLYINPFELIEASRDDDIETFNVKKIKKLRSDLLQEIDLEDGMLPWMGDIIFDKSKIISNLDDLSDEFLKEYHWAIFRCKNLLNFLSKGEIYLFTEPPARELIDIRIKIREDDGFASWLGKYYAKQFDKIFSIALQKNKPSIINILLGGRRLVADFQIDLCYEKSHQTLNSLVLTFKDLENKAEKIPPSYEKVIASISDAGFDEYIFNLPQQFKDLQTELARLFRNISISCNNIHGNPDLAKLFLQLAKKYTPKNSSLALKIKEDENKIDEIIAGEKKKESHLVFGSISSSITKEGLKHGSTILKPKDITSVRWGILITNEKYSNSYNYLFIAKGLGTEVRINWSASNNIEKQQALFEKLIDAFIEFIFPSLVEKIKDKLAAGMSEQIGPCRVFDDAVQFETKGWFSSKTHVLKWNQVKIKAKNGMIIINDKRDPSVKVEMSPRDTDNASILHALVLTKS